MMWWVPSPLMYCTAQDLSRLEKSMYEASDVKRGSKSYSAPCLDTKHDCFTLAMHLTYDISTLDPILMSMFQFLERFVCFNPLPSDLSGGDHGICAHNEECKMSQWCCTIAFQHHLHLSPSTTIALMMYRHDAASHE